MTDPILTDDQPHDEADALLPWYATGQLDPADRAVVEKHLESCARCRQQLAVELGMIDAFRAYAPEVDSGWARLRTRLEPPRRDPLSLGNMVSGWLGLFTRPAVAAIAIVQLAFVILVGALLLSLNRAPYQALNAPTAPAAANIIVMFRPSTSEADLRRLLDSNGARFVDGPTENDAYLLRVPPEGRPRALAALRADPHVTLAQAIDGPQP